MFDLWNDVYGGSTDSDSTSEEEHDAIPTRIPVVCMGRQPGSDTYVLGPHLQFQSNGEAIPEADQRYIWVQWILKKLGVSRSVHPVTALPTVLQPLQRVLRGLERITGPNWPSGVMMLSAAVISLFYKSVLEVSGGVSIYIAWGVTSRGKSNSVQVALAAAGNHAKGYKTYLSESSARRYLSGALPFAFDDPNNGVIIKQLLINAFGGAEMGTERGQFRARRVPLVTANVEVVDELSAAESRYLARAILVPFVFEAPKVELGVLKAILADAPAAFPDLLSVGSALESLQDSDIAPIRQDVVLAVGEGMDSRLATQYSISMMCALQLVETACDPALTSEGVMTHFKEVIVPEIQKRQVQGIHKTKTVGELLGDLVVVAPLHVVLWMVNPRVKYRAPGYMYAILGIAIILKEFYSPWVRERYPQAYSIQA